MNLNDPMKLYASRAGASLEQAESLPFETYHDSEIYAAEMEAVFRNEWVFVCAEQEIPSAGDFFACDVAGESILILRGRDGVVRALSNNCRHRGTPLCDTGYGTTKSLVCPYHGWSYDDQGGFRGAPYEGSTKVEAAAHCLPAFRLEAWHGLLFVHLGAEPTALADRLSGIDEYLAAFKLERFKFGFPGASETWQANWKLIMENAMESYHLFKVHQKTLETLSPTRDAFYLAGSDAWSLTAGKLAAASTKVSRWLRGDTPEVLQHYMVVSIPPAFVGILTEDSFGWLQVLPAGPITSQIRPGGIAASNWKMGAGLDAFTKAFFEEDRLICERVQAGMYSRTGRGGKLVEMERIVVDFHRFLAGRLFGAPSAAFYRDERAKMFVG